MDCGLHVIYNLRLLFENWMGNIAALVSAVASKTSANFNLQ